MAKFLRSSMQIYKKNDMVFCCRISFYDGDNLKYIFYSANEIEIKKTWRKYTQTALIKFPRKMEIRQGNIAINVENLSDFIKKGDRVVIELGYNNQLVKEFDGYVSYPIKTNAPYEIECEDEMWKLKQKMVSVSLENTTVRKILEAIAPEYEIYCADEYYGDFSETDTPIKLFDKLRKTAGLYTFFRGKRLVCGLPYADTMVSNVVPNFKVGENIIDFDIKISTDENTKLKVYGRSIQSNGDVIYFDKGDEGGNITKIDFKEGLTKNQLKELVENKYKREIELGSISGKFKTFGFPFVEHGQQIHWYDNIRENISAHYFVDEIIINVSASGGYRKEITPGQNYKTIKL